MRNFAPGFLLGVWIAFHLTLLPGLIESSLIVIVLVGLMLCWRSAWLRLLLGLVSGAFWVVVFAHCFAPEKVPATKLFKPILIKARVVGLPSKQQHVSRFTVVTTSLTGHEQRLKLSWYYAWYKLRPGQLWQLNVKLKPVRGLANPTGNHLQAWALLHGVSATGYVLSKKMTIHNKQLGSNCWLTPVSCLRFALLQRTNALLAGSPMLRFVRALTLGDKQGITTQDWSTLQRTGTSHLIAISGLHIGLVAGVVFFLAKLFLKLVPAIFLRIPLQPLAAMVSLLAAFFYSALAGFALPTQRALIMLSVFYAAILFRRAVPPWHAYCLALLLVLLLSPAAVLSASFWLSFAAVAIILYAVVGYSSQKKRWIETVRLQWVISLGLLPFTLAFFNSASLIAPLVNLLAIPWITFLVVPMSLLASLISLVSYDVSTFLFKLAAWSMQGIWWVLSMASSFPVASFHFYFSSVVILLLVILGSVILLAPRGLPGRYLASFLFLPALFPVKHAVPEEGLRLTVLDVGQGLAIVVQTHRHALLYDAGEARAGGFDSGKRIVTPFLESHRIAHLDKVIISHADNDHAGGAPAILKRFHVGELLTSSPSDFHFERSAYCHAGQAWHWDGVLFQMLAPFNAAKQRNNLSCVLKISVGRTHLLLPGDIEKPVEYQLVKCLGKQLAANILIAPHHGSQSSSTWPFVLVVQPKWVVFSAGFHNRFHFPASNVVARYQRIHARLLNTASDGAISFLIQTNKPVRVTRYRALQRYWWQ